MTVDKMDQFQDFFMQNYGMFPAFNIKSNKVSVVVHDLVFKKDMMESTNDPKVLKDEKSTDKYIFDTANKLGKKLYHEREAVIR